MDHLPLEILTYSSSFLHGQDLNNFRLVSRTWAAAGIQNLEIGIHFYFRERSLKRLHNIAQHPLLSRKLKEVVFYTNVLPLHNCRHKPDRQCWAQQVFPVCNPDSSDEVATKWMNTHGQSTSTGYLDSIADTRDDYFMETGWRIHKDIHAEQTNLLQNSTYTFKCLQDSLSLLPNLINFTMETLASRPFQRLLMRPLHIVKPDQAWYCYMFNAMTMSMDKMTEGMLYAALSSKITDNLTHNIKSHLRMLNISCTDFYNLDKLLFIAISCVSVFQSLSTLRLQSSQMLDWNFGTDGDERDFKNETHGVILQKLLAQAPKLQALDLAVRAFPRLGTMTIFKDCVWRCLTIMHLRLIEIDVPSFEPFLSIHSKNLEQLSFTYSNLVRARTQYGWIDLFEFIKNNLNLFALLLDGELYDNCLHGQGKVLGKNFIPATEHTLPSGIIITKGDVANLLVCGHPLPHLELGNDDILSLTWEDLYDA